jgi:hypothetical protein
MIRKPMKSSGTPWVFFRLHHGNGANGYNPRISPASISNRLNRRTSVPPAQL